MIHEFRARLAGDDLLIGTLITLGAPEVSELMAEVGFDWLFIDAEHSTLEAREIQALLQGAGPATPCLVRLPCSDEAPIKKVLDAGAAGIIVPQINSAEQARRVVGMAKYAPAGWRGVGVGRAQRYGLGLGDYVERANASTAVVAQAEHIDAVRNIEEIVRVPGIDAILVGPYDLSASLGRLGQVEHPDVRAAIERVTSVCRQAGMPLGIFGVSAQAVEPYIQQGYRLIVAGVDTLLLGQASQALLGRLRGGQAASEG